MLLLASSQYYTYLYSLLEAHINKGKLSSAIIAIFGKEEAIPHRFRRINELLFWHGAC